MRDDELAAVGLMNSVLFNALFTALNRKGLITPQDGREIFEHALLLLEEKQGSAPASQKAFALAREAIGQQLRPKSGPGSS